MQIRIWSKFDLGLKMLSFWRVILKEQNYLISPILCRAVWAHYLGLNIF